MSGVPPLPVRRLRPEARPPERAHPGDAGLDLFAAEGRDIAAGGRAAVPTGLAIALRPATPASWCRAPGSRAGRG